MLTCDLEDVTLPLGTQAITFDLSRDALVQERAADVQIKKASDIDMS